MTIVQRIVGMGCKKNIEDLAKSGGLENGTFPQNLLIFLLCRQSPELSEGYHLVSEIIKFLTSPQIVSRPVFTGPQQKNCQCQCWSWIANNFTISQFTSWLDGLSQTNISITWISGRKPAKASVTMQNRIQETNQDFISVDVSVSDISLSFLCLNL